ncbi:MAG: glycosyltransferase family 2 protein [Candidatus Pacebacteria bacterium]|nr:glycosyltransferase family 2 protein [Candidatus Paceibacterota bacterium]
MKLISIIIPAYNEEKNIPLVYDEIKKVFENLKEKYSYEIIFIDDGSKDKSSQAMESLNAKDEKVKYIQFSRNFGKEAATSAGINNAKGDAALLLDADLQHPPKLIPEFLKKWEEGADIVIGVRNKNKSDGIIKKIGSSIFYKIINLISDTQIIPQSTDFRLLDKTVIQEFNKLTEKNRITRGLIDWLGFKRDYIYFNADERSIGEASYSTVKLVKLALSTMIAHSFFPLKFAGYLGIAIVSISCPLGLLIFISKYILKDPWGLSISGSAILATIILFLIGIVLICLGLMALYIASIQSEVINRPLYVARRKKV